MSQNHHAGAHPSHEFQQECMTSSVISFAYFVYFSNLNISGTNADFANSKRRFYCFVEFYVIHLKYQGVKICILLYNLSGADNLYIAYFCSAIFLCVTAWYVVLIVVRVSDQHESLCYFGH